MSGRRGSGRHQGSTVVFAGGQRGLGRAMVAKVLERVAVRGIRRRGRPGPTPGWSLSPSTLPIPIRLLRLELEPGVRLGYTDTDRVAALDVPKTNSREVAKVLADELTRHDTAALSGPVEHLRAR